jgi:spore coat polysaccharide biosynthesis protein SpsF
MTLGIIQARTGSSRLPNKAFADLMGKPLIQHVIERAQQIALIRFLVLAVPAQDVALFSRFGVPVYGFADVPEADVLTRFWRVAERYPACDAIMRLTGDCPLLDPHICQQVCERYVSDPSVSYASNVHDGYIDGTDCEVFSRPALEAAYFHATDPIDREHVTAWIRRHMATATLPPAFHGRGLKTSVDTVEDLARVREMMTSAAVGYELYDL